MRREANSKRIEEYYRRKAEAEKILANLDTFLVEDMYVSMKAINLINTLALKASNTFREHLKSLKLIELRDKLL